MIVGIEANRGILFMVCSCVTWNSQSMDRRIQIDLEIG